MSGLEGLSAIPTDIKRRRSEQGLGGEMNELEIPDDTIQGLWDNITQSQALTGEKSFRCFYFFNNNAIFPIKNPIAYLTLPSTSPNDEVYFGWDPAGVNHTAQSIADEFTDPLGVSFINGNSRTTGAVLGQDIPPFGRAAMWVKRDVQFNAQSFESDTYKLALDFERNDQVLVEGYSMAALGNTGCGDIFKKILRRVELREVNALVTLGGNSFQQSADCWLTLVKPLYPIMRPALGKPEFATKSLSNQYKNFFGLQKAYYSFEFYNVHVVNLSGGASVSVGSEMYTWAEADLKKAYADPRIEWIIVCAYDEFWMATDSSGITAGNKFRDNFAPLFEKYKVHLFIQGRPYNYQRLGVINWLTSGGASVPGLNFEGQQPNYSFDGVGFDKGFLSVIVGNGAANADGTEDLDKVTQDPMPEYVKKVEWDKHGYLYLEWTNQGRKMSGRLYDKDDNSLDNFSIINNSGLPIPGGGGGGGGGGGTGGTPLDDFGIRKIYRTANAGRIYNSNWHLSTTTDHQWDATGGQVPHANPDPQDSLADLISPTTCRAIVDADANILIADTNADRNSWRYYIQDPSNTAATSAWKWSESVEITAYYRALLDYSGGSIHVHLRLMGTTEHWNAIPDDNVNACSAAGHEYSLEVKKDGTIQLKKEEFHISGTPDDGYAKNQISTVKDAPYNQWIGLKLCIRKIGTKMQVEGWRDLTDGFQGGTWQKIIEKLDDGTNWKLETAASITNWGAVPTGSDNCLKVTPMDRALDMTASAVGLRVDNTKVEIKKFSVREIDPTDAGAGGGTPGPDPNPNPGGGGTGGSPTVDANGLQWLFAKGAITKITQSRNQPGDSRWSKNFTNTRKYGYEATGIATFHGVSTASGGAGGHWAQKMWGPNHTTPCDYQESSCCCWYDIGIRPNGDLQLQIERPHPHNEDFTVPKASDIKMTNIGVDMEDNPIGLKWLIHPLKPDGTANDGGIRIMMWADIDPLDGSGKPKNNWKLVLDTIDRGTILGDYPGVKNMEVEWRNSDTDSREVYAGGFFVRLLQAGDMEGTSPAPSPGGSGGVRTIVYAMVSAGGTTGTATYAAYSETISHEIIEAQTNADAVGTFGPMAWRNYSVNPTLEIADECPGVQEASGIWLNGYWSNSDANCVCPAISNTDLGSSSKFTTHGGPILKNPKIWLIFWGTDWRDRTAHPTKELMASMVFTDMLVTNSAYFSKLSQYGGCGLPKVGGYTVNVNVAIPSGNTISELQGRAVITDTFNRGLLPIPEDSQENIYVLIPPISKGVKTLDGSSALGFHDMYKPTISPSGPGPTPNPNPNPNPGGGTIDYTVAAVGDWDVNSNTDKTVNLIKGWNPGLVIGLGDYSYEDTEANFYPKADIFKSFMKVTLGNHETAEGTPQPTLRNNVRDHYSQADYWHAHTFHNIRFICMCSELDFTSGSAQHTFISNELAAADANPAIKWIIVYCHSPFYPPPGSHHTTGEFSPTLRSVYHTLFQTYNVDLVLYGHNHNYDRTFPLQYNSSDQTTPIKASNETSNYVNMQGKPIFSTVGTGGRSHYPIGNAAPYIVSRNDGFYGVLRIDGSNNGNTLTCRVFKHDGSVFDAYTLNKT